MAQPSSGGPSEAETEIARIRAVAENAQKLGMTWGLRPATVLSVDPLTAAYDGDGAPTDMKSMMGAVSIDERVYGISVPPGGNYLSGRCLPQPMLRIRLTDGTVATGVTQDVPFDEVDEQIGDWGHAVVPFTTIAVPEAGIYHVSVTSEWGFAAAAGSRQDITILFNSTIPGWLSTLYRGSWSNGGGVGTANATLRLNKNDNFFVRVFQNSVANNTYDAWLTAVRKSG